MRQEFIKEGSIILFGTIAVAGSVALYRWN